MISIYVTFPSKKSAKRVAKILLEKRLIACANIFKSDSLYVWDKKIQNEEEYIAFMKSDKRLWKKLKKQILKDHPYDVPCILKYEIEANEKYVEWAQTNLKI